MCQIQQHVYSCNHTTGSDMIVSHCQSRMLFTGDDNNHDGYVSSSNHNVTNNQNNNNTIEGNKNITKTWIEILEEIEALRPCPSRKVYLSKVQMCMPCQGCVKFGNRIPAEEPSGGESDEEEFEKDVCRYERADDNDYDDSDYDDDEDDYDEDDEENYEEAITYGKTRAELQQELFQTAMDRFWENLRVGAYGPGVNWNEPNFGHN